MAYIVEAVRTAGGKKNGVFASWHPVDLAAQCLSAVCERARVDPRLVDDVILGCVSQVGAQGANIARMAVLAAGFPESVPGTTVDRQCGSSQQAFHFAAQAVMSGTQDVVIAGGVEVMSLVPIGAGVIDGASAGHGNPHGSQQLSERYPGVVFSQFDGAEIVAERCDISREDMDAFALESHRKAHQATQEGRFAREILPLKGFDKKTGQEVLVSADEGIRWPSDPKKIASLRPLREGGRLTAATASQITDGASAVLVCSEAGLRKLGLRPRAKVVSLSVVGSDPIMMLYGPVPASQKALQQCGLSIQDMALYEVNEAFGSVPLAWQRALGADITKLNVNGGAQALGHPLGCTGTKLITTLLHELERTKQKYGLVAICEGAGTSNCTIIERIPQANL